MNDITHYKLTHYKFTHYITSSKHIFVVLYALLMLTSFAVIGQRALSDAPFADNSIRVWFNTEDPDLHKLDQFNDKFGNQEWGSVLIKTDNIYDKKFLNELSQVTEEIEGISAVYRATSLANVRGNRSEEEGELWFTSIFEANELPQWSSGQESAQFKARLNDNKFIKNLLYQAGDSEHTFILIQSEDRKDQPGSYRQDYVKEVREIFRNKETFEVVKFQGVAPLIVALNRASLRDVFIFYSSTAVLLLVFGFLVFRSVRDTVVLVAMAMGVMAPAMAGISAAGIPYNMMTQILPVLLVAVSTANVVHLIKEFHFNRISMGNEEALQKAISMLWVAGFWAATTTLIGFASFIISEVRPVSHFGMFGSFGIGLGFLLSLTLAPALLLYLYKDVPVSESENTKPGDEFIQALPNFLNQKKYFVLAIFVLCTVSLIGLKDVRVGSNFSEFLGASSSARSSFDYTKEHGFSGAAAHLSLTYKTGTLSSVKGRFSQLIRLEQSLQELVAARDDFYLTLGPGKILWEAERALSQPDEDWRRFQQYTGGELSDLIFSSELSGNDQLVDFLSEDKKHIRIALLVDFMESQNLHQFRREVEGIVRAVGIVDADVTFTGAQVLLANMDSQIADTQRYSLMTVAGFLLILFPVLFKSVPFGLFSLFFNMFPLALIYSLMAWSNITINLATVIVGGVSLSLVVDDTIHVLVRFSQYRKMGYEWNRAVNETIATIGHSVTLTSVVLIGLFSVMALSDFVPVQSFGIFMSLTVFAAWLMDLFLLPVLLKMFNDWFPQEARNDSQLGAFEMMDLEMVDLEMTAELESKSIEARGETV